MEHQQVSLYIGVGWQDRAEGCHIGPCAEYFSCSRRALVCCSLSVITVFFFKKKKENGITLTESERSLYASLLK